MELLVKLLQLAVKWFLKQFEESRRWVPLICHLQLKKTVKKGLRSALTTDLPTGEHWRFHLLHKLNPKPTGYLF